MGVLRLLIRSNRCDRVAARALFLALLLGGGVAGAQASAAPDAAAIVVTFDPSAGDQSSAISAVKAHVSGLPVRVVVEPTERARTLEDRLAKAGALALARGALGTFSIEIGERGELLIFFTEPDGSATLIRRLPPSPEGIKVAIEQAAIVVRSLVEALLEGRRIGMTGEAEAASPEPALRTTPEAPGAPSAAGSRRQQAEAQAAAEGSTTLSSASDDAPSEDSARPRPRRKVAISGGYRGTSFASTTWQSGLALGVRWLALPMAYGALRYTVFPSLELGTEAARVSVARHPLELVAGLTGSARFAPQVEAGVVLDYTSRETLDTGADYRATPSDARWVVALVAGAGVTWSASAIVDVSLRGGADFLLTRYSYVVAGIPEPISTRAIRPRLDLELAFGLW